MNFFHYIFSKIFIAITNMKIKIMTWCLHIYCELLEILILLAEASFQLGVFYIWLKFSLKYFAIIIISFCFLNILIRRRRWVSHICFNRIKLCLNILFVLSISIYTSSSFCIETLSPLWLFNTVFTVISILIL